MTPATGSDIAAVAEAGPLLRFAAEHVPQLDPELSSAIAEAEEAIRADAWTPQIAQRFWHAFATLCDVVKPVTLDAIAANRPMFDHRSWLPPWTRGSKISLAERTSARYMRMLVAFLIVIIPLQLYTWSLTNLSKDADSLAKDLMLRSAQLSQDYVHLNTATMDPKHQWTTDETTAAERMKTEADTLVRDGFRADYQSWLIDRLTFVRRSLSSSTKPADDLWYSRYDSARSFVDTVDLMVLRSVGNANLVVGIILSFCLPILLGAVGALAFVIRTISDQIRTTTFTASAAIRHLMRVTLGALMGVVIGLFNPLSTQVNLSPLALAFLAGYGVEAVFSFFDGIIARFRQPAPSVIGSSSPPLTVPPEPVRTTGTSGGPA